MSSISSIENQEGRYTSQCLDCRFVVCHFLPKSSILLTFQELYIHYLECVAPLVSFSKFHFLTKKERRIHHFFSCMLVYKLFPKFSMQSITTQCLEALQFLHGLGLIHCDLKPENILVKSYSRCEVKVIDLGSSCFETDHLCSYVQSRSYRAPEVILGHPYDKKIDVWSLGCILAELCTGNVSLNYYLFTHLVCFPGGNCKNSRVYSLSMHLFHPLFLDNTCSLFFLSFYFLFKLRQDVQYARIVRVLFDFSISEWMHKLV
jgi:serine/threonine protein kinase